MMVPLRFIQIQKQRAIKRRHLCQISWSASKLASNPVTVTPERHCQNINLLLFTDQSSILQDMCALSWRNFKNTQKQPSSERWKGSSYFFFLENYSVHSQITETHYFGNMLQAPFFWHSNEVLNNSYRTSGAL